MKIIKKLELKPDQITSALEKNREQESKIIDELIDYYEKLGDETRSIDYDAFNAMVVNLKNIRYVRKRIKKSFRLVRIKNIK